MTNISWWLSDKDSTCPYERYWFDPWIRKLSYSRGVGNGNQLQYSGLENPTDRGAWWTPIQWVTKRQTQLKCTSLGYIPHIINMPL